MVKADQQCHLNNCQFMDDAAKRAADSAVQKVFAILGVDVNKPESVEEFRQDLRFGKKLRKMADHGSLAMAGVLALALCWAIWEGIRVKVGG